MLRALLVPCLLAAAAVPLRAGDTPEVDPGLAPTGKVCQWRGADGLKYEYFIPASYDSNAGAGLTVVLHGNGLDQRWTFANHPAGKFRPDDIVVSPDGTTYVEGTRANEFLGDPKDAGRVHALLAELKKTWKISRTFLYGHSQGSFFVFYYAGAFPEDIDGVCGQSSGVWNWTNMSSKGHRLAIDLMHGTRDGNVPYGQSWWGREEYQDKFKFPLVHLRTLFDWGHPPVWRQAEAQLAWCEGMTTESVARLQACLQVLGAPDLPLGLDWAALWAVADRLAQLKAAPDEPRAAARGVADRVDKLAQQHLAAIDAELGKGGLSGWKHLHEGPAVGHLIRLLEDFDGVPAREAWAKKNQFTLKTLADTAQSAYDDYQRGLQGSPDQAFAAGLKLVDAGYLHYDVPAVLDQLDRWAGAGQLKLSDADRKKLTELGETYRSARKDGFAEYEQLNKGAQPLNP
jgi:pimeloyl-ACP methyl ester carboxylesterase